MRSRYLYPSPALITRIDTVTAVTSAFVTKVRRDPQEDSMDAPSAQESARNEVEIIPAQTIHAIVTNGPPRSTAGVGDSNRTPERGTQKLQVATVGRNDPAVQRETSERPNHCASFATQRSFSVGSVRNESVLLPVCQGLFRSSIGRSTLVAG